jgi:hypothetical protein
VVRQSTLILSRDIIVIITVATIYLMLQFRQFRSIRVCASSFVSTVRSLMPCMVRYRCGFRPMRVCRTDEVPYLQSLSLWSKTHNNPIHYWHYVVRIKVLCMTLQWYYSKLLMVEYVRRTYYSCSVTARPVLQSRRSAFTTNSTWIYFTVYLPCC